MDEVLEYLKVKKPVKRVLINDLETSAVKQALADLRDNAEFKPLSLSALVRGQLDWLFGINSTRAYTLLCQANGEKSVLSVGRVQTPVLGLVVKRDTEIEDFKATPYFDVAATFITTPPASPASFQAQWQTQASQNPRVIEALDASHHLLNKAVAEDIASCLLHNMAIVQDVEKVRKKTPPPLPYSLSALQIDGANQLNLNASAVLTACQMLYEKHKLITYPRSDCHYLPSAHHAMAPKVLTALMHTFPREVALAKLNIKQKTNAWNDSKVSAHHAIIPTINVPDMGTLNSAERDVYRLICFRYFVQFYADHEVEEVNATLEAATEKWLLSERQVIQMGWKKLALDDSPPINNEPAPSPLTQLRTGDVLHCEKALVLSKKTPPPARFTDATLLSAMLHVAHFVTDPAIKKRLRETDGLGTEATRAAIIDILFKRGYLKRKGNTIVSTEVGRQLIAKLPAMATTPDLTATFEAALEQIRTGEIDVTTVIKQFQERLNHLIENVKKNP
ncbi:MAG: topoisomerase [Gammaproteobacteria bacterium]|nr:topoisomerase [Gammaproteobacteria bacterium]